MCSNSFFEEQGCFKKYAQSFEDADDYCLGWKHGPCDAKEEVYKYTADAWKFTSSLDIWGIPVSGYYTTYGGGGYIAKLDVNKKVSQAVVNELYNYSWVDRQTRAVLFEFTLYCINTNTFSYNMFMVEFPETGGVFPYFLIYPIKVYQHLGPAGIYTLVCEVIFAVYVVVLTVILIIGIVQQKREFFRHPWQVYDLVFVILCYIAVVMYIVRLLMTGQSLSLFKTDKKAFINFYHIAIWNVSFVLLIGCLTFMITLRMLNVLGYNKRIGSLSRVFRRAAPDLIWFGMLFTLIFVGYSALGFLLFGSTLKSYKNVFTAMSTLFINMIGMIKFTEIDTTYPVMSKIYFMFFILIMVYMILTIFLSMLSQAIDDVHSETKEAKEDEMVEYAIKKLKNFMSYGRNIGQGRRRPHSGK